MITYGSTTLTSYNTITKIEVYYYQSTSPTTQTGGSWSTTKPTWVDGRYVWQKIRTTYEGKLDNGSYYSESDPVNITGQQGATGTAAYSYKLNSSDSIIGKTKDGEYTIKKITFSATYKQGTGAVSAYGGRFKIESTTNGSTWKTEYTSSENEASKEFTIPDDIIAIKCSLYQSDGTTVLLDIVTVPVVKDGVDAIGLRDSIPYYLASDKDTGITRLTQGWTRYRPQLTAEKKYLWVYYVSRYSEGTTEPELIEIKDDLVHFVNNGDESPVESCVVDIEPVQDLHGYDSPWPAGGGKNKLFAGAKNETRTGLTVTAIGDGSSFIVNGTTTANVALTLATGAKAPEKLLNGETYTISGGHWPNTQAAYVQLIYKGDTTGNTISIVSANSPKTITLTEDATITGIYINFVAGNTFTNDLVQPQFEVGSTATAFAPYSNECPITGWEEVGVEQTGKNLCMPSLYSISGENIIPSKSTVTIDEDEYVFTPSGTNEDVFFGAMAFTLGNVPKITGNTFVEEGKTYTATVLDAESKFNKNFIQFMDKDNKLVSNQTGAISIRFGKSVTFTVPQGVKYIGFRIGSESLSAGNTYKVKIQFELGSTATDYEPYSGQTYSIAFPSEAGTVYGGTLDVTKGELVVDRAIIDITTGNDNGVRNSCQQLAFSIPGKAPGLNNFISNLFSIGGEAYQMTGRSGTAVVEFRVPLSAIGVTADDSPSTRMNAFMAWLDENHTQLCYELATPITYTLTPQEITMLCKENNIFADTGQTTISYYNNQTSTDPYVDYSATSAFEYANTAINRATATYGTCSTAATTPLKEVVCENFILFDGVRIQVAFENANSTNVPSLNVNNTGAKQILINQAIVSESNQLLWAEDAQMEFVYDGTYWVLQNAPYSLYGICSVTEEIPEKVIECAEAVICKGTTITVDFMYSNTSDNTVFNVANIAQKPLLVNGDVLKVNSRFNWHAGAIRTFYFDGQAWNMSDDIVSAYIDEYETEQDEDGIMVHPVGQKNTGWSIGSTLELLKNGVSYIKMWFDKVEEGEFSLPFIRIGKESGNHVLVGDDAVTIREDQKELAHYSSLGITFDDETPYKIGNDTTYIAFEDTDNDAKADALRIVADSISFHSNGTEKDLRSELEGLNENIDLNAQAIEQNAEAIENTQKYIQIDPEVPSIKLATNDRNYLLIESNKLGFWVDANETAYMSQNQMNIPTASITNLLMQTTNAETGETIGQIGWVMRTNGHLSLKIMN